MGLADLGVYVCKADNKLGDQEAAVFLHGEHQQHHINQHLRFQNHHDSNCRIYLHHHHHLIHNKLRDQEDVLQKSRREGEAEVGEQKKKPGRQST